LQEGEIPQENLAEGKFAKKFRGDIFSRKTFQGGSFSWKLSHIYQHYLKNDQKQATFKWK